MAELVATPIVALDVPTAAQALQLVRALGATCGFYKVGGELFTAEGPSLVRCIRELGHQVFLDLKFHDIPSTVRGSVRSAVGHGASMVTVHASGGMEMLRAAVDGAGATCLVMGVTVLTSLDAASLSEAWGKGGVQVDGEVLRLAGLCAAAGAHGIVCSGHEVAGIRAAFPRLAPLVPGIRFEAGATHDQARVVTPRAAVAAGARYLVLGRAVTAAPDPRAAMERALEDLALRVEG